MIKKATHIILAFLMFFSSTGFVLNKHFCQDQLKSVAVFVKAESCHAQQTIINCPMHGSMDQMASKEVKGCCDDTCDYIKSDTDQLITQHDFIDLQLAPVLFCIISSSFNIPLLSSDVKSVHYLHYKPPLIVTDLPVSLQTFRC